MPVVAIDFDETPPASCRGGVVTIGNFDGVHRGHARLASEAQAVARLVAAPTVALTFDPPPLHLLRPELALPSLTTMADRADLLLQLGIDWIGVFRTSHALLQLTPGQFFDRVLVGQLQARALAEGPDFRFGHNRAGDVQILSSLCQRQGMQMHVVPKVEWQGLPVSSSRIRADLLRGDVRQAAELLGRPFRLRGIVAVGQRRGRALGFPTANLEQVATLIPADGVYAVRVLMKEGVWPGAANIGPNPTFGEQARKVEVHLIGFEGDLYGRSLAVDFIARLRETRPFAGVDQLIDQLHIDVQRARDVAGA